MKGIQNLILRTIAGETILIPTGEETRKLHGVISLSESGTLLWNRLKTEASREDLIALIQEHYDVDSTVAAVDVDAFIAQMKQLGILMD